MHEAPVFLSPGKKVGPYTIEHVLGHGANGIAYLAHDKALDRKVVLKEHYPQGLCCRDSETHLLVPLNEEVAHIFAESVDQFIREARLIASLEHPSIIKIHRVFSLSPSTCFYVMPLVEGGTMQDIIRSGKRIPSCTPPLMVAGSCFCSRLPESTPYHPSGYQARQYPLHKRRAVRLGRFRHRLSALSSWHSQCLDKLRVKIYERNICIV